MGNATCMCLKAGHAQQARQALNLDLSLVRKESRAGHQMSPLGRESQPTEGESPSWLAAMESANQSLDKMQKRVMYFMFMYVMYFT